MLYPRHPSVSLSWDSDELREVDPYRRYLIQIWSFSRDGSLNQIYSKSVEIQSSLSQGRPPIGFLWERRTQTSWTLYKAPSPRGSCWNRPGPYRLGEDQTSLLLAGDHWPRLLHRRGLRSTPEWPTATHSWSGEPRPRQPTALLGSKCNDICWKGWLELFLVR